MNAPERIHITEVAPRDGLQNQPAQVATADKIAFIDALVAAGLKRIEATSFVSPKAVPQMADAAEVLAGTRRHGGVRFSTLIPNLKGLERAVAAGAEEIAVVLSATETMNQRNIGMSLGDTIAMSETALRSAREQGLRTRAYVAVAFECPFEGPVAPDDTIRLSERMLAVGADEIVIADTIGAAAPGQVTRLTRRLVERVPAERIGMHFHDTRGLGAANAYAALEAGIRRFDSSAGGIGGCPFAPGAAGNLATEDLVLMAERSGFETGVDLDALIAAVDFIQGKLGGQLGGHAMRWLRGQAAKRSSSAGLRA